MGTSDKDTVASSVLLYGFHCKNMKTVIKYHTSHFPIDKASRINKAPQLTTNLQNNPPANTVRHNQSGHTGSSGLFIVLTEGTLSGLSLGPSTALWLLTSSLPASSAETALVPRPFQSLLALFQLWVRRSAWVWTMDTVQGRTRNSTVPVTFAASYRYVVGAREIAGPHEGVSMGIKDCLGRGSARPARGGSMLESLLACMLKSRLVCMIDSIRRSSRQNV